jgi:hypothetical protein
VVIGNFVEVRLSGGNFASLKFATIAKLFEFDVVAHA